MRRFNKLGAFFSIGVAVSAAAICAAQPPPGLNQVQKNKDELQVLPQPRIFDEQAGPTLELVEFRGLPLLEAMRLLSQQSGLRIVTSEEAAKKSVSLYLKDVTALVAVREVTQASGLIYRREPDGIIRIFTRNENVRDLTEFRDQQTEVFTLLYPNAVSIATAIRDLYGDRVVELTYGADDTRVINDLQQRFSRFDLLNSRSYGLGVPGGGFGGGIGGGIGGFGGGGLGGFGGGGIGGFGGGGLGGFGGGGFGGFGGGGIGGFGGGYGGGSTIADTLPTSRQQQPKYEDQQKKVQALSPTDRQALEKALSEATQPEQRAAIIDILTRQAPASIYVTVIRQHNQLMVRTSDAITMAQIRDLVCRCDVPTPVVLLEVKILSIDLKDDFKSVFDFQFTDGSLVAGGFTPSNQNILPPFADALNSAARRFAAINPGPIGNDPGRDLVFQIVSANFRARLQLLEDKLRVTEVSAPLLMTANNEVSQIFVGTTQPITIGFTPSTTITTGVTTATNSQATPITTLQDIGSTLLITPNINADRTVTLRIHEERSRVIPAGGKIPLPTTNGTGFTDVPVDTVQRQNVTGTIVAKDGLAIAIGGLIEESVSDSRQEVPVLGRIPYVGVFFRRQLTERRRTETVIVIRPFVLTTPAESVNASRALLHAVSIHPSVVDDSLSMLGAFLPNEVLRPSPPRDCWEQIFKVHMITPKDF